MEFRDEFEYEIGDNVYNVEVEGTLTNKGVVLTTINVYDSVGNQLDNEHEHYDDLVVAAKDRDYEVEEHNHNFDYYDCLG